MKNNFKLPNPFFYILEIWKNTEPSTKKWIFGIIGLIIIISMITGNFDTLVGIFSSDGAKK